MLRRPILATVFAVATAAAATLIGGSSAKAEFTERTIEHIFPWSGFREQRQLTSWSTASAALDFSICPGGTVDPITIGSGNLPRWTKRALGPPMTRVTLSDSEAVCNDGSPGVMFLRPASSQTSADKWIIHFKGGGSCATAEACYQRWCALPSEAGREPAILDRPSLMSSQWTPTATVGKGIQSIHVDNEFADWNHVLLHYCSSDLWMGDSAQTLAQPSLPNGALLPQLDLQFRGARIVEAAFAALFDGHDGVLESEVLADMPSLKTASHVIISGDSSGSVGVITHLDRVASWISNGRTRSHQPLKQDRSPRAQVLGVIDAAAAPSLDDPHFVWPGGDLPASYEEHNTAYAANLRNFWHVSPLSLDESCIRFRADDDPCYDPMLVLKNYVTAPVFVRNDLIDPVMTEQFFELGLVASQLEMAQATRRGLLDLLTPGKEPRPGNHRAVFGPLCLKHIAIRSDEQYLNEQVVEGGRRLSGAIGLWANNCFSPAGCQTWARVARDNGPNSQIFDSDPPSVCR